MDNKEIKIINITDVISQSDCFDDNSTVGSKDSDSDFGVVLSSDTIIRIKELDLFFANRKQVFDYLDDNIYLQNNYYTIKLKVNNKYYIQPYFRNKQTLVNFFFKKFID